MGNNIMPLRMIRIVKDLKMKEMAAYFEVTPAYIGAIENGEREMNFRTIKYGLDNLGISRDSYEELVEFQNKLINSDMSDEDRFKFMLIKTLGVVSPELKEQSTFILNEYLKIDAQKRI